MKHRRIVYQSVPRFVQGPGILVEIGGYAAGLCGGGPAAVIMDPGVRFLQGRIEASLKEHGITFKFFEFDGNLNQKRVAQLGDDLKNQLNPSLYIGVGGGKTIDLSKMLARASDARNIVVATASATDAAPSHAAVGADDRGHISAKSYNVSPDIVLVDSEVIVKAPARLFVAGIGDAVSKKFELETAVSLGEGNIFGGERPFFVDSMAEILHQTLISKGRVAKKSVEAGELSCDVEQVITCCILLSTLVWENGGLAGAHSIANVLFNSGYCRSCLHGEQVAVGLLVHLTLEQKESELTQLRTFYRDIDLPCRLSALGEGLTDTIRVREIADGIRQRWKKHNICFSTHEIAEAIEQLEHRI